MLGTPERSTILRLRVKGSDLDPLALRGRLQNLLGDVSLQPRLPPSATLFIRKLNDPMPGLLQLDAANPRAPEAWRHAFNTRFEQLVSTAARPAYGLVADSAESVVFYDYSELLASLTADWCSGYATARWWWQALIKQGDVSQVMKRLWREKIEYVPAALEQLVKRNALVEFVSRLSEDEARELVQRVVHVFALHEMQRVIEIRPKIHPQITQIADADFSAATPSTEAVRIGSLMPWRHTAPESDTPRLRPAQQLFVGVALMIRRAPARVRTLSFAKEVEQWQEQVIDLPSAREPVAETITVIATRAAAHVEAPVAADEIVAEAATSVPDSTADGPIARVPDKPEREQVKIGNAVFSYEEPVEVVRVDFEQSNETVENHEPRIITDPEINAPPQTFTTPREALEAVTIETELGGLFYLVNLAIFLNIYSDFTSPVERFTTDLSIWDFVTMVGAEILGEQEFDDPIWTGLQDLQDSQDKNPANLENPVNPVPAWLAELLPQLKSRLRQALGINTDTDLAKILLHHHAKVIITATHLDVFFALAKHPIEIRLSGLDRNPGWVPAAGRFIAFHYD